MKNLKVYVHTRPNLRDEEMLVFVGQLFLKRLFDEPDYDLTGTDTIVLQYPERWLNLLELRALFPAILDRCPNLIDCTIITHSEHIGSVTPQGCLFIVGDMNKLYPEIPYFKGVRYSPELSEERGLTLYV